MGGVRLPGADSWRHTSLWHTLCFLYLWSSVSSYLPEASFTIQLCILNLWISGRYKSLLSVLCSQKIWWENIWLSCLPFFGSRNYNEQWGYCMGRAIITTDMENISQQDSILLLLNKHKATTTYRQLNLDSNPSRHIIKQVNIFKDFAFTRRL